ncbi:MarR family transcriptional regulator [Arsukibacterium indicum]|uniref:MarR family transcriptional regulator n=1 Tax=Arsukibacterium indicum TaxID=2848612 RepID=A0ABS6MK93_9GAMM|nr:MarR family transcriptional regulator [Arsukibacterium indicum]MBV2128726.1 MarR family transcriptional regulator [Arsukibacterium indicum]
MNKINQVPALLNRVARQWHDIHPELPVEDAALVGLVIGVGANADTLGLQQLKPFNLCQTEHDVLACARRQGPPFQVKPSLLLEEVRITSGALTTCLNRLIDKALIDRVPSETDMRSRPIRLTGHGLAVIDELTTIRFHRAAQVLNDFSANEKAQLKHLLFKLQQGLSTRVQ